MSSFFPEEEEKIHLQDWIIPSHTLEGSAACISHSTVNEDTARTVHPGCTAEQALVTVLNFWVLIFTMDSWQYSV